MKKLFLCAALASALLVGIQTSVDAQLMSSGCGCNGGSWSGAGNSGSNGCNSGCCDGGGYFTTGQALAQPPACGTLSGGLVGTGCGTNGGQSFMPTANQYPGGYCGTDTGNWGNCYPQRRFRPGLIQRLRQRGGGLYLSGDFGVSFLDSPATFAGPISALGYTPTYDFECDTVVRVGVGKYFGCWRLESELGVRSNDIDEIRRGNAQRQQDYFEIDGVRESTTAMFNIFRDFNPHGRIRPYAKGGIGYSFNDNSANYRFDVNSPAGVNYHGLGGPGTINGSFPDGYSEEFTWSVGGGLGIVLTERVIFDVEYQYLDMGPTYTGVDMNGDAFQFGEGWAHEITLGLRINL